MGQSGDPKSTDESELTYLLAVAFVSHEGAAAANAEALRFIEAFGPVGLVFLGDIDDEGHVHHVGCGPRPAQPQSAGATCELCVV